VTLQAQIVRSLMMVITPKHVGAVLMQILILFLKQFSCASVGDKTLILVLVLEFRHLRVDSRNRGR
jgi:hypothetical protein